MARLPTVGSDNGNWGTVLNEFLGVSHNSDGTIKNIWINVKDYGALGDGSTNDTSAIQSTIEAVKTAGGGTVYIPEGTYILQTAGTNPYRANHKYCLNITGDNIRLYLDAGATLKLANNQQTDAGGPVDMIVIGSGRANIVIEGSGSAVSRITGNTSGQTGWTGGYTQSDGGLIIASYVSAGTGCNDLTVKGLKLDSCFSNPVYFGIGVSAVGQNQRIRMEGLYGLNCGEGFQAQGVDHLLVSDSTYEDTANVMVGDAFEAADCRYVVMNHCTAKMSGATSSGSAFDLFGVEDGAVTNFTAVVPNNGLDIHTSSLGTTIKRVVVGPGIIQGLVGSTAGIQCSGTTVEQLGITGIQITGSSSSYGLQIPNTTDKVSGPITISNCTVKGVLDGILVRTIQNLSIIGGQYIGNAGAGIHYVGQSNASSAADTKNLLISGVVATGNGTYGINLDAQGTSGKEPTGVIEGCVLDNNTSGPIGVTNGGTGAASLVVRNCSPASRNVNPGANYMVGLERIIPTSSTINTLGLSNSGSSEQMIEVYINANGKTFVDRTQSGVNLNMQGAVNFSPSTGDRVFFRYDSSTARWDELFRIVTGIQIGGGGTRISKHLSSTTTWDPASTLDAAMTSTTLTVTGAAIGDTVAVGFSVAVPAGALLVGAVTATNTVTVTLFNKTGSTLDLASGTLRADVWQH